MDESDGTVTALLARLAAGDRSVEESLLPLVFTELHRLAAAQLRSERAGHTLQATALVNEAYLKLCGRTGQLPLHDRSHFVRLAARVMRQILVDYARQRNSWKRGFGKGVPLDDASLKCFTNRQLGVAVEVDDVLNRLSVLNPRQVQVVEMRFFLGLQVEEIAECLGVDVRTVKRDWYAARAWLYEQLERK
jgi:RNA polymerase sigma-70 factor, ECF subfamily